MSADKVDAPTMRERILDAAERLFTERGYISVTLRDIGKAVAMQHASLYYYAPGGKEQIFIEVTERSILRHQAGMAAAIGQAGDDLQAQLHAAAGWLLAEPPLDLLRLKYSDLPLISPEHAERLLMLMFTALRQPVEDALIRATRRELVDLADPGVAALVFVTAVENLHLVPTETTDVPLMAIADSVIAMFLRGWLRGR